MKFEENVQENEEVASETEEEEPNEQDLLILETAQEDILHYGITCRTYPYIYGVIFTSLVLPLSIDSFPEFRDSPNSTQIAENSSNSTQIADNSSNSTQIADNSSSKFNCFFSTGSIYATFFNSVLSKQLQAYMSKPSFIGSLEVMLFDAIVNPLKLFSSNLCLKMWEFPDQAPVLHEPPSYNTEKQWQNYIKNVILQKTILFLNQFPQFFEIVVNCLRKTEIEDWETLFSNAKLVPGCNLEVLDLFAHLMKNGMLNAAANLLKVIQHEKGLHECSNCALSILQPCLNQNQFELAANVVRFLGLLENEKKIEKNDRNLHQILSLGSNNQSFFELDEKTQEIISEQLKKYLKEGRFLLISVLIRWLNIPFTEWLVSQKISISNLNFDQFPARFRSILNNLGIPFCDLPKSQIIAARDLKRISNQACFGWWRKRMLLEYITVTQVFLFPFQEIVNNLRFLLEDFFEAKDFENGLLLALLLLDLEKIEKILFFDEMKLNEELFQRFFDLLKCDENMGYNRLMSYLKKRKQEILKAAIPEKLI